MIPSYSDLFGGLEIVFFLLSLSSDTGQSGRACLGACRLSEFMIMPCTDAVVNGMSAWFIFCSPNSFSKQAYSNYLKKNRKT